MDRNSGSTSTEIEFIASEDPTERFWEEAANRHRVFNPQDLENGERRVSEFGNDLDDKFASLPRARTNVEAILGLVAAFAIGIPVPFVATVGVVKLPLPNQHLLIALATVTFLISGYLCLTVLRLGSRAIEGDHSRNSFYLVPEANRKGLDKSPNDLFFIPLALAMAIRLPDWWTLIRPFIAIWWLGHFVIAAFFGHLAARQFIGVNNPGLVTIVCTIAVTMAFLFAANLYLMLALAVSIPLPRIWLLIWRYRFVVDLFVTAAMIGSA